MGGPRSLLFGPTLFYNKNVLCATNLVLWWNFVGGKKGLVWLHGIAFGIDGLAAPLLVVLRSTAAPMSSWSTKCLVQCLVLVKTSKEIPLTTGTQEENLLTPRLAPHVHDATAHKPFFGQETKSVTQKKTREWRHKEINFGSKDALYLDRNRWCKGPESCKKFGVLFFSFGWSWCLCWWYCFLPSDNSALFLIVLSAALQNFEILPSALGQLCCLSKRFPVLFCD